MADALWSFVRIGSVLIITIGMGLQFLFAWKPFNRSQGPKALHALLLASGLIVATTGGWLIADQIPQLGKSRATQIADTLAEIRHQWEFTRPVPEVEELVTLTEARTQRARVYDIHIFGLAALVVWVLIFHQMIVRPRKRAERKTEAQRLEELLS